METVLKKECLLKNLCCPMCAGKIEEDIRRIDGVLEALIDFPTQKLKIKISNAENASGILNQAAKIAKKHDKDITLREITAKSTVQDSPLKTGTAKKRELTGPVFLIIGTLIFITALIFDFGDPTELFLFLASYLLVGGDVLIKAIRNIPKGRIFDENFLMTVAAAGAFFIGEYPEAVAIMLFYQVGEIFERLAVNHSRKSIADLMDIRPDYANLKTESGTRKIPPEEVSAGDLILVKPGEKIPLDGIVVEGISALDTSALTGEIIPRDVSAGVDVLSGCINKNGLLVIKVSKEFKESTASKILDLVQNAQSKKSKTENFITTFSRYYTPCVVAFAFFLAILPPLIISGAEFSAWIHRALIFLVVSCPCALMISVPLSFFAGIGCASKNGILVKGGNYLEALRKVDTVIFDKTGTLTKGKLKVTEIQGTLGGWSKEELLYYAAYAESSSTHPIALSICREYKYPIQADKIGAYEETAGKGVSVVIDNKTVLAGNDKLLEGAGVPFERVEVLGTIVYLAIDGVFAGCIVISDEIKQDSKSAIAALKAAGVRTIAMFTGDSTYTGERVGKELGLDLVFAGLLPQQKVEKLEMLEREKSGGGKLVFVGDGINDAPALARSDIGVAMGGIGSDAAIEAADVVLMTDEPSKLVGALRIAKKTHSIVSQNITFALGVKLVIMVLGALGFASMWAAVFGDVGVTIIAILNSMRAMRVKV